MAIVRWDSSRDVTALQERISRMFEGLYVRPQEDLTRGMKMAEFEVTAEDNTA